MTAIVIRIPLPSLPQPRALARTLSGLVGRWQAAMQRRAARRYLSVMDDAAFADLGVSRAQALFDLDSTGR